MSRYDHDLLQHICRTDLPSQQDQQNACDPNSFLHSILEVQLAWRTDGLAVGQDWLVKMTNELNRGWLNPDCVQMKLKLTELGDRSLVEPTYLWSDSSAILTAKPWRVEPKK